MSVGEPHRVLIAEQEGAFLNAARAYLCRRGFMVEAASDGPLAIARLAAFRPHAMLVALHLPRLDLDRVVAAAGQTTRIVVLGGTRDPRQAEWASSAGARQVLVRGTFSLDELVTALRPPVRSKSAVGVDQSVSLGSR